MTQYLADKIALAILAGDGSAAIRQPQAAAALAHRTGNPDAADAIEEVVKAAEAALDGSKRS